MKRVPKSSPVEAAVLRAKANKAAREHATNLLHARLQMWSAVDGEDGTDLLSKLALSIGVPCVAWHDEHGRAEPAVRLLHGALRTIQQMCLEGYRWRSANAPALDRALELASEYRSSARPDLFMQAWIDAVTFSAEILAHKVTSETISSN